MNTTYPANVNGLNPFAFRFTVRGRQHETVRYYPNLSAAQADAAFIKAEPIWRNAKNITVQEATPNA